MNIGQPNPSQEASRKYYRITDETYLALCPEKSAHMNLGRWPANTLELAQGNLVLETLQSLETLCANPNLIVEGGPGWGGARPYVSRVFPSADYLGINCSQRQIDFALQRNASFPRTTYSLGFLENLGSQVLPAGIKSFFAIESIIHVQDKEAVFRALASHECRNVVLAEICLENKSHVMKNSLFDPSLRYTWASHEYEAAFHRSGYTLEFTKDLTTEVFRGWSEWLDNGITTEEFVGNKRILAQFRESYRALAKHAACGEASYQIFAARLR